MKTKICRICQEERKISKFQKREDGKLRNECNLCFNSYQRDRYALIHGNRLEVRRESREADPKCCIKCGEEKSLDEFGFHNRKKGQHRNMCKSCQSEWTKEFNKSSRGKELRKDWNEKNVEKIERYRTLYRNDTVKHEAYKKYQRDYWLLKQFGITPDDYKKMLEGQNGKCAICGAIESHSKGHRLAVDHDHETGKIRGLLCHNCNVGLGNFKDSPDLIRSAIEYLK